ncbi:hypothetical protein ACLB2K_006479 [Fragaria x ananassa]
MALLNQHEFEVFLVSLWAIWSERNKLVWEGGDCNPAHMAVWALQLLEEYQKIHVRQKKRGTRPRTKWSCPPSGRLKINVDGAFRKEERTGRVGVIARDGQGRCVAALSRHIPYAQSALHVEAEAVRAGLLIAFYHQWENIEVESDSAIMLQALTREEEDLTEVGTIVNDCKSYMQAFNFVSVWHIFREAMLLLID